MSKFKMNSPYKKDPVPVYEVPFDDPNLMGKANKCGSIIMNKDHARNPEMREKILKHEKHHLKQMIIDKNPDGSPVLDYDEDSVTYKGVNYSRDDFDEGDKKLPWETEAYEESTDTDIIPNPDKLSPVNFKKMGENDGHADEDEVNMNESFNPLTMKKKILQGHRGNRNPFKMLQEKGLLNKDTEYSHLRGPSYHEGFEHDPPNQKDLDTEATSTAQTDLQKNIDANAYVSTRYDKDTNTDYFDFEGTGDAEGYRKQKPGDPTMGNDKWKAWLLTPEGKKYTASKNVKETIVKPRPEIEEEKKETKPEPRNLATFLSKNNLWQAYNKKYYDSATEKMVKHTDESFMKQYGHDYDFSDVEHKGRESELSSDEFDSSKYDDVGEGRNITGGK